MDTPPQPTLKSKTLLLNAPKSSHDTRVDIRSRFGSVVRPNKPQISSLSAAKPANNYSVPAPSITPGPSLYQARVINKITLDRANKSSHESRTDIRSRIGSVIRPNKPQISSSSANNLSAPAPSITPGPSRVIARIPPPTQSAAQPLRAHLIQDTRMAPNRIGPVATATKAPLSVSQYTQPTTSSNKHTQQVSRAHSEPSIKYQIKVNDKTYKVLNKIGSGGSAKVYEGFEANTYQSVAIKIINVATADPRTRESYFNEIAILSKLKNSKHVVRMFNSEYKKDCKELIIVMEKGEVDLAYVLSEHFKSREQQYTIDGIFIKSHWRGMLLAVEEIHKYGIVHADLKPVNFILVKGQLKLIDFGIANSLEPDSTSIIKDYQIGTINYMAPEALRNRALDASFIEQHNQQSSPFDQPDFCHDENNDRLQASSKKTVIKYNSKADIWSLGCILYNIVYGRPPFDKYSDIVSKLHAITNPNHVINFPGINNRHLMDCMESCLRYNPSNRPTAQDLLNHEYLRNDIVILRQQEQHKH